MSETQPQPQQPALPQIIANIQANLASFAIQVEQCRHREQQMESELAQERAQRAKWEGLRDRAAVHLEAFMESSKYAPALESKEPAPPPEVPATEQAQAPVRAPEPPMPTEDAKALAEQPTPPFAAKPAKK